MVVVMTDSSNPKNTYFDNGRKYHKRWTVLDVDDESVQRVKNFAHDTKTKTGAALTTLLDKVPDKVIKTNQPRPVHYDVRLCDYRISQSCTSVLQPREGTPHYGFTDTPNLVKWACNSCEAVFDEE